MIVKGQTIFLPGVLCFVPINLICNMTTFRKKGDLFTQPQSKVIIFASMLLYADKQHYHILKKLILCKPM